MRVNTNVNAIRAQRQMGQVSNKIEKNFLELGSGSRITQSAHDPTGLAMTTKMESKLRSSQMANRNANDSVSLIQIAEGSFNEIQALTTRMRQLAIQASSDPIGDNRRFAAIEFDQLKAEVQRITDSTEYNGTKLLSQNSGKLNFQVGIHNNDKLDRINMELKELFSSLGNIGINSTNIASKQGAQSSLDPLERVSGILGRKRAQLGAIQARMSSVSNNLMNANENSASSISRIRDTDYAEETARKLRLSIMHEASTKGLKTSTTNIKNQVMALLG